MQYKVKQVDYKETTQELEENLKNARKKVKEYYRRVDQAVKKING